MIVDWVWANNSLWIVFSSRSVDLQDFKVGMMIAHYTLHYTRLTKWKPLKHLPYAALAEFPHYLFFQYSSPFTLHSFVIKQIPNLLVGEWLQDLSQFIQRKLFCSVIFIVSHYTRTILNGPEWDMTLYIMLYII